MPDNKEMTEAEYKEFKKQIELLGRRLMSKRIHPAEMHALEIRQRLNILDLLDCEDIQIHVADASGQGEALGLGHLVDEPAAKLPKAKIALLIELEEHSDIALGLGDLFDPCLEVET